VAHNVEKYETKNRSMKKLNSLKKLTCKTRIFTPFQNVDFNKIVEFAVRRLIRDVNKFYTNKF